MSHRTAHLRRCALCLLLAVLWAGLGRQGSGALRAEGAPSRAPAPVGLAAGGRGDEVVAGAPQSSQTPAPAHTSAAQGAELPHVPGEGDYHQQVIEAIRRYENGVIQSNVEQKANVLVEMEEIDPSLIREAPEHVFVTTLRSTDEGVIGTAQNIHTIYPIDNSEGVPSIVGS